MNNLRISLDRLQTFVTVARAKTFADAAKQRAVSVSSVSQQMKALEGELGQVLFERVGRTARLTIDGRFLLDAASAHLGALDEALTRFTQSKNVVEGLVRIGSPRTFGRQWLGPRLPELLNRYPKLSVEIMLDVPSVLERQLADGLLDVVILVRPSEVLGLESTVIARERFVAVCHPSWLPSRRKTLDAQTLLGWRWLLFDADRPMHAAWWKATFGVKAPEVQVAASAPSLELLLTLAEGQTGAVVLPEYLIEDAVSAHRLAVVPVDARKSANNSLFLAWRRSAVDSARFHAVRSALTAELPQ